MAVDDGYVIAARDSLGYFQTNLTLIKTDREGNVIWNRSYYGFYEISSLIAVDDGYIVTGLTSKYMQTYPDFVPKSENAFMAKFDRDGNMAWWEMYDWMSNFNTISVAPAINGYVLAGTYGTVTVVMGLSGRLVRTDLKGNEMWNRTYGRSKIGDSSSLDNYFYSILPADDGYIIGGQTKSKSNLYNGTAWLMKTDLNGNEIWNRTYIKGYTKKVINDSDGFVLLVKTLSGYHLIKTDESGNEIRDRDPGNYLYLSLATTPDSYVLSGDNHLWNSTVSPVFLIKTDQKGNQIWNTTYDLTSINYDSNAIYDRGTYVIAGLSAANNSENKSIFLMKTLPEDIVATASPTAAAPAPATDGILAITTIVIIVLIAGRYGKPPKEK